MIKIKKGVAHGTGVLKERGKIEKMNMSEILVTGNMIPKEM